MKSMLLFIFTLTFSALSLAAEADAENGDELHMEKCSGCHDSSVYTRTNKRVKTLPKLGSQVRFCKDNLGITWFDDEVNDVVHYLNKNYYHF